MGTSEQGKIVENHIDFFRSNLRVLIANRPNLRMIHVGDGKSSKLEGDYKKYSNNPLDVFSMLQAYNTSIILNCFSLFEASLETFLLHDLDVKNLEGVQKNVMLKYIQTILNISSESAYSKEFKFIKGQSLQEFFNPLENDYYTTIKRFYIIRHILIHGSGIMNVFIPEGEGGRIVLDDQDKEYQYLLQLLSDKSKMSISYTHLTIDRLIQTNDFVDILVEAVLHISKRLTQEINYGGKFITGWIKK